ncbi:MAG: zinc-binding dehydrogenase [Planctomycetes bacterium]|nr:zinc-binding dehydrogenase [Planctomycetota bacterium]
MSISTLSASASSTAPLPRTSRAAILVEQRKPLVVDTIELPETLAYGQVLVHLNHSGICGSQLGEIDGAKGEDKFLPHLLGHEGSGEVLAVGPGVKFVNPGDAVVLHWMKGRGIDAQPAVYGWQGKRLNAGWVTTFNEFAIISENRLTPIRPDFDREHAALFGCAVTTGLGVVNNNAQVRIGESVVVFGAGGVGLNVVQGAALAGANPIIAVDLFDNRLELAGRLGATHLINGRNCDAKEEIRKLLGPAGADVCIDNTGQPTVIELAYELTQAQGRTVLVGVPKKGNNISIYSLQLHFGKSLSGSHGGETKPNEDIARFTRLNDAGRLDLAELITDRFSLEDINEAIAKMRSGEVTGRAMIDLRN